MQVHLYTAEWDHFQKAWSAAGKEAPRRFFQLVETCPILRPMRSSASYNQAFGDVVERSARALAPPEARALRDFAVSFCHSLTKPRRRPPLDARLFLEAAAVMSPATLRELIVLPEQIDRQQLRAAVADVIASAKDGLPSAEHFFDYLNAWHRAYRLAEAEDRACFVVVG